MERWGDPAGGLSCLLTSASLPSLSAAENKFAKFLMTCLKCCFWCLEKFIRFLNRNAYIMVRRPETQNQPTASSHWGWGTLLSSQWA